MWTLFEDRVDAGRKLAARLAEREFADPVVLALPRGGIPVAAEIARVLHAPLDLLLVRKIGAPMQPELAVAAIIDGDHPETVVNEDVARMVGADDDYIKAEAARELAEIERRRRLYIGDRTPVSVTGRTAIVVDDGIATGATMRVALKGLKRRDPAKLIVAAAVAPPDTVAMLQAEVDEVVCIETPAAFGAIGLYYRDFRQIEDAEVIELLAQAERDFAADGK